MIRKASAGTAHCPTIGMMIFMAGSTEAAQPAAEAPAAQEEPPARKGGYVTYAPVTGSESEE